MSVTAGSGFVTFHLPPPLNTVSLGICMDLNVQPPAVWDSLSSGPYEIADYCISQRTNLLVLLNAWLDSGEEPEEETDWRTLNYWASRLRPLWAKVAEEGDDAERGSNPLGEGPRDSRGRRLGEEVLVVVCNRCGTENGSFVHQSRHDNQYAAHCLHSRRYHVRRIVRAL